MPPPDSLQSDRPFRHMSNRHRRSPSPATSDDAIAHRPSQGRTHSDTKRSARRGDDVTTSRSHRSRRDENADDSPPPAKRRRRSGSRERNGSHRHRYDGERSRSPYRGDTDRKKKKHSRRDESLSRSKSPPRRHRRDRSTSRTPPPRKHRHKRSHSHSRSPAKQPRKPLPSQEQTFRGELNPSESAVEPVIEKQKPNFAPTGLLAKESNTVAGTKIVLKYNEPPAARKPPPSQKWQLFVFKGDEVVDEIPLYTRSCWLLGREAAVVDLQVEHPSCSKQHAVVQFRHSVKRGEFGERRDVVRPYIIDLESANGTQLNGERIKDSRYYEVKDKDLMRIGLSERDYVFMLPPS